MCFCYYDTKKFAGLTPAELEAIPSACKPHDDALNASGKKALLGSFTDPGTWKSVRPMDGGEPTVTEGPFLSTQEQVGAFFAVEARDMDQAVAIASLHPG